MGRIKARALGGMATLVLWGFGHPARAQDDDDKKKPTLHEMARVSSLPKAHADFSHFLYRPVGDKVIEQPDAERLLFRTREGAPDGYAERRGGAVIYYDRFGKVVRVQPFEESVTLDR